MLFSSPLFLFLFLPILLGLYFVVRPEGRNVLLLAASLLFYLWGERGYVVVLLVSIVLNYGFGLWLGRLPKRWTGKVVLALAVFANLLLLVVFKYANFLVDNLNPCLVWAGLRPFSLDPVHLPLGISFFTFQALSYVIDVYRGEVPAQKSGIRFALYKTLFPQLIAGPIVRYKDVAGELTTRSVTLEEFAEGAKRFIIGLGKKMLIANTLATAADALFAIRPEQLSPRLAWLGIICYTLQIYFDFSGYSDMAIGLGRLFGFHFLENFRYPYAATSLTDFWRRWHISLSSWFRDYLYIPLGGSRCGRWRVYFNLTLVFALCGLWHGASWNFLIWGLFHGAFLVAERMGLGKWLEASWRPLRHVYVVLLVMAGWVFFRAATLTEALGYFEALLGLAKYTAADYALDRYLNLELMVVLSVAVVGALPVFPTVAAIWERLLQSKDGRTVWVPSLLEGARAITEGAVCLAVLVASSMLLAAGTYNPFIYFRF
jgi:alginate O-acetyltransferase complex protein AlgI